MKRAIAVAVCLGLAACGVQQRGMAGEATQPVPTAGGLKVNGTVRTIQLPDQTTEAELPKGTGQPTAQAYCITCHTVQYVMLQPRLSRATWLAEVTKMRTAFSAPIPEDKVNELVDYLDSVRGAEAK